MQMLSAEIEELEPMGYKDDLRDLQGRIDEISKRLPTSPAQVTRWQKASPIIAAGALVFAAFAFWSNHSAGDLKNLVTIEVGSQLKDPLRRLGETESDVRAIKEYLALGGFHAFLNLPKSQSEKDLPQLRRSLELAGSTRVSVPAATIEQVRLRLADMNPASPDYWPTVVRFLQVATAGFSPKAPPSGQPHLTIAQLTATGTVSGQTIELADGIRLENITFVNCRIIFTANPIEFHNVRFVDSAIDFNASGITPYIQRASKVLLSSDLRSVSFELPANQS
jgi:hypothetical protein